MSRRAALTLAWFALTCCQTPPAENASTTPVASTSAARASDSHSAGCAAAPPRRARVRELLAEGKLHRALSVLAEVNRVCPGSAADSQVEEVTALAEIGRYPEAKALAQRILAAPAGSAAARTAAESALELVRVREPAASDPSSADTLLQAALQAAQAGTAVEAQRLFDRATLAFERLAGATVRLEAPNGLLSGNLAASALTWSRSRARLAAALGNDTLILAADTLELQARLVGHQATVLTTAFSPDGTLLATGSKDQTVKLWRVHTGELVRSLAAPGAVLSITFGPDGKLIAGGVSDGSVRVWRAADGVLLQSLEQHPGRVAAVAFAQADAGDLLAAAAANEVRLWRPAAGERVADIDTGSAAIDSIALSADGSLLATSSRDGTARLWRTQDRRLLRAFPGPAFWPTAVALAPDASVLATSGSRALTLWRVRDGKRLHALGDLSATSIAFAPDASELAVARATSLDVWRSSDGQRLRSLEPHAGPVRSLAHAHAAQRLAAASGDAVWLWDYARGRLQRREAASPEAVACSQDGRLVVVAASDGLKLEQAEAEPRTLWSGAHPGASAVAISPDRELVASASADTVVLWRARDGHVVRRLRNREDGIVAKTSVAFSPDGATLVAAAGAGVKVWRVADGSLLGIVPSSGQSESIAALSYVGHGADLALGTSTRGVELRRVEGGALLRTLAAPSSIDALALSPDGRTLAGAGGGFTGVWRVADGSLVGSWQTEGMATAAAFSHDGWFAVGDEQGDVRVRRVDDGRLAFFARWMRGASAGVVWTEAGAFDFIGQESKRAEATLRCRIGARYFPLDLCRERFFTPGLIDATLHRP